MILLGPVDFFISKASINFSISAGTVGERKNEALDGFINDFPLTSLISKYSLKLPGTIGHSGPMV